jgi:hypothetical protein
MRAILIDARRKSFTELVLIEPVTLNSIVTVLGSAVSGRYALEADLIYIGSDSSDDESEDAFQIHGRLGTQPIIGRRALVLGLSAELAPADAATTMETLMTRTTFLLVARRPPVKLEEPEPPPPRLIPILTYQK